MQTTDWKAKNLSQTEKSKALKKRIKELTKSRDDWRAKSIMHKERADKLTSDLKKVKNKMKDIMS